MIKFDKVSYSFPQKDLYTDVSFTIEEGQHCAFIGASGSGKSTLLASLSGIYNYQGSIKLLGIELKDIKDLKYNNFISCLYVIY